MTSSGSSVRFGLSLPNRAVLFGLSPEVVFRTAEEADASGVFDSVWVGDNLLSRPRLESIVTLSAIAARTKRVRLGAICFASFVLRHPIVVAIQWASLDVVSGGRTILAVCNGGAASRNLLTAAELKVMGVGSAERPARLREGIAILRRSWANGPISFQGKFYQIEDVEVFPKPMQAHVPIQIAINPQREADTATEERALRRVAKLADGWQSDETPPETFRRRWQRIREYAAEYGRADEVRDASYHLMVNINDDAATAYRESAEFLERYYGAGRFSSDETRRSWLAFGPPEAVIAKITQFIDAGCTMPVLRFTSLDQRRQLERCVAEVLPAFTERMASAQA